jgi:hypothetical protein
MMMMMVAASRQAAIEIQMSSHFGGGVLVGVGEGNQAVPDNERFHPCRIGQNWRSVGTGWVMVLPPATPDFQTMADIGDAEVFLSLLDNGGRVLAVEV